MRFRYDGGRASFLSIVTSDRRPTMPLVRIDLVRGKPASYRKALGEIVYTAMRETIDVPLDDKFQIITEHAPDALNIAPAYHGNHHSHDIILIQITMSVGRPVEKKKALFRRIADDLHAQLGLRQDDVFINLVETV